jgi:hypothetical protein
VNSTPHPLEKVIAAYGVAWNSQDVEAILAMHTEDSVFENHTSGGKGVGKDAIREILKGIFAVFPDIHFDARRTYVRDGLVTQEWTASATLAVPFTKGSNTVQPSGKRSLGTASTSFLSTASSWRAGRLRRLGGFPAGAGIQASGLVEARQKRVREVLIFFVAAYTLSWERGSRRTASRLSCPGPC